MSELEPRQSPSLSEIIAEIRAAEARAVPGPWKSFGKQAVVITEAKRDILSAEVIEQGQIIFGSPGWVDDESDNRIPDEQEVGNCDLTALARNHILEICDAAEKMEEAMERLWKLSQRGDMVIRVAGDIQEIVEPFVVK